MVDPITAGAALATAAGSAPSWLPWAGAAAGTAAGIGSSLMSKGGTAAPPSINLPSPSQATPPQEPTPRPLKKSMQPSFLSGAAAAQQAGPGPSGGKTLLGA